MTYNIILLKFLDNLLEERRLGRVVQRAIIS